MSLHIAGCLQTAPQFPHDVGSVPYTAVSRLNSPHVTLGRLFLEEEHLAILHPAFPGLMVLQVPSLLQNFTFITEYFIPWSEVFTFE